MEVKIEDKSSYKNMRVIGTYINLETYNLLKKEADEDFLSVSSLLKKIIYKYLKSKN